MCIKFSMFKKQIKCPVCGVKTLSLFISKNILTCLLMNSLTSHNFDSWLEIIAKNVKCFNPIKLLYRWLNNRLQHFIDNLKLFGVGVENTMVSQVVVFFSFFPILVCGV